MLPHIKGWNGTWMLWVMVIVWHSKNIRLFRGTGFCQYKQQLLKRAWMQLGTSYLVGGVSPQQYFHHSIESCTLLDWVRNPSTTCLSSVVHCGVLLRKHDTRFTASADQHKLFERAEETWQRCSHAPLTGRIWLKSGLCLLQLWPTLIKIISEVYRKMCWLCFFLVFFLCQCAFQQWRHARIYCIQTREGFSLISSKSENPLCLNKGASLFKLEGWLALPSGSRHEELADGGCSCSQVGEQAGDWLAFPLDQAHLSGEFTVRPFHIGSLSDWAATGAKGSHFSPCAISSLCLFPPHLNLNCPPG